MAKRRKKHGRLVIILLVPFVVGALIGAIVGALAFPRVETEVKTEYITEKITEYRYIYTKEEQPEIEYESLGMFEITAYCSCSKCCGSWAINRPKDANGNEIVYTATGAIARPCHTIAVDPSVIPYGSEVIINGTVYTAEDSGGAIKGKKIDIYMPNHLDALRFGKQTLEVFASK